MRLMQTSYPQLRAWTLRFAGTLFSLAFAACAAEFRTNTPAKSPAPPPAATSATRVETEIPKSVFNLPTTDREGKDPFYPLSTRMFAHLVVKSTNRPPVVPVIENLQLKALSGVPGHRFAIINNQTFEAGEEGDVITKTGRTRVRCLEIKDDCVLVQVGGEQRVLRLRPGI